MEHAKSFRDLIVYQNARKVASDLFTLSKTFPKEEAYSLTDQVRRSTRSIGANVEEVWAKRRFQKHFISKLTDADGEQQETQHWIEVSLDCSYISQDTRNKYLEELERIGRMLQSMINKSGGFCGNIDNILRESEGNTFCPLIKTDDR